MVMKTPHVHQALMTQWASDTSVKCWFWCRFDESWKELENPSWIAREKYAVGDKPVSDTRKVCFLGGTGFPNPETDEPWLARYKILLRERETVLRATVLNLER